MTRDAAGAPDQLPLQLPHDAALGRADFIVGESNKGAVDVLDRWPQWPERGVLLVGPAGSGKSHLTEIWRAASDAVRIDASSLDRGVPRRVRPDTAIVVEDLHTERLDEATLFHLVNAVTEQGARLLLTSRQPVASLGLALPDLVSRLRVMQEIRLAAPDDALLEKVLAKLFSDRQLVVEPAVIAFLLVRMERSLEAAGAIADHLDRLALAKNRAITRRLAAEALDAVVSTRSGS